MNFFPLVIKLAFLLLFAIHNVNFEIMHVWKIWGLVKRTKMLPKCFFMSKWNLILQSNFCVFISLTECKRVLIILLHDFQFIRIHSFLRWAHFIGNNTMKNIITVVLNLLARKSLLLFSKCNNNFNFHSSEIFVLIWICFPLPERKKARPY